MNGQHNCDNMKTNKPKDYDGVYHAGGFGFEENKKDAIAFFKHDFPNRKIISVVTVERGKYWDIYYIDESQQHGYKDMVFACRHVLSGKRQPEKPICYRDGVYACKECRDMKQRGIMPDIVTVHPECLADLGILTR